MSTGRRRWQGATGWLVWSAVVLACLVVFLLAVVGAMTVFDRQ